VPVLTPSLSRLISELDRNRQRGLVRSLFSMIGSPIETAKGATVGAAKTIGRSVAGGLGDLAEAVTGEPVNKLGFMQLTATDPSRRKTGTERALQAVETLTLGVPRAAAEGIIREARESGRIAQTPEGQEITKFTNLDEAVVATVLGGLKGLAGYILPVEEAKRFMSGAATPEELGEATTLGGLKIATLGLLRPRRPPAVESGAGCCADVLPSTHGGDSRAIVDR